MTIEQWLTVAITAILALITAYYACQTKRMVQEMVSARRLGAVPVLKTLLAAQPDKRPNAPPGLTGQFNELVISNVGNSPAVGAHLSVQLENPAQSLLSLAPIEEFLGTLGVGEQKRRTWRDGVLKSQGQGEPPRASIVLSYRNPAGVRLKTRGTYLLQTFPALDGAPMAYWAPQSEDVEITE